MIERSKRFITESVFGDFVVISYDPTNVNTTVTLWNGTQGRSNVTGGTSAYTDHGEHQLKRNQLMLVFQWDTLDETREKATKGFESIMKQ